MFLEYLQPSIELFHFRIDEPVTTATDLLLASACFYAYFRLQTVGPAGRIKRYFSLYFLSLGLGALSGGILGHALLYRLAPPWKLVSWILILLSVALAVYALVELSRPLLRPLLARGLLLLNLLLLATAVFITSLTIKFLPVTYYSLFGMFLVVGTLSLLLFSKTGNRGAIHMLVAVGLGMVSAVIFIFRLGLSPWFNHNDICHVILSISVLSILKGATLFLGTPVTHEE